MPEKDITPGSVVLITGNIYNVGGVSEAQGDLEPGEFLTGVVVYSGEYDEQWGQKWRVKIPGCSVEVMSEQDLSPIPELRSDPTERGFINGKFVDLYGSECSIQESSLATEGAIWFGVNDNGHFNMKTKPEDWNGAVYGKQTTGGRMHLSQGQAAALLPLFQHFVLTGSLPTD